MKILYFFLSALFFAVNSQATIGPITGTTSLCIGTTASLSNAATGGTWSCASIYANIDLATGVVTGTAAGSAIITYATISGSATTTITVIAAPSPIYGSASVCSGNTYSYYCSPAG